MINVKNEVRIYAIGGSEDNVNGKILIIHSHWINDIFVDIEFPGFSKITVASKDLIQAIMNAQNSAK